MELRTIQSLPRYEKEQKMAKPNENFRLNVKDIELIEKALFLLQTTQDDVDKKTIVNLLAKLYHQKNWYRPKKDYVSG
jgi:hypothetical protein